MIGWPLREPRTGLPGVGAEGIVLRIPKRYDSASKTEARSDAAMTTPIFTAIATQDRGALRDLLAEDVTFNSPVRSYTGREEVVNLLATIGGLEDELRPTRSTTFVQFGKLDGVLHEAWDDDGQLKELTLTLRPLGQLLKAVDRMGAALREPAGPAQ
jgi:hypothetical protein